MIGAFRYQKGINADNFFGYNKEEVTGATNTVQDSFSGITGATVRLSEALIKEL
ncbi:hypothetical protein KHA80_10410 [Anaerobacillus sp. HL2]|nr:hypothetical protein KHA80_10410 [Anaerobacillus sp. HL2]